MRKLWLLIPLLVLVTAAALYLGGGSSGESISSSDAGAAPAAPDSGQLAPPSPTLARETNETGREVVEGLPPAATDSGGQDDSDDPVEPDELVESYPDPLERGECALFLEVYSRDDLVPVGTTVHLWRLEAPGNEHWEAGAQHQATLEVGTEGRWFRELPAGRYRARCLAERRANDDPHEFVVSGATTRHRLSIDLPREREVLVKLFDDRGDPIRTAEFKLVSRGGNSHSVGRPAWAKVREPKFDAGFSSFGVGGGWSGSRRVPWKPLQADADGWFRPGSVREGQRDQTPTYRLEARVEGLAPLSHSFDGDEEHLQWVSVLIDPRAAQSSVVTPDGRRSHELEDGLRVSSGVLPFRDGPADAWRRVPIEAWRRWEQDYQDLEFEFTLDDLPLPTRVLVEKPAKD